MKFKNWLWELEEASNQKFRPPAGNMDQTTGLGPTSQYGHRAMMPISWGIDNRAVAGVIDGIGDARAKIRARKGAEPGVASQYHGLDRVVKDGMTVIYLPLQLPNDDFPAAPAISKTKGLIARLRHYFGGDPLKSPKVWKVSPNDNTSLVEPTEEGNQLYYYLDNKNKDQNEGVRNNAEQFTLALMEASIAERLKGYAHVLNTENPILKNHKIEEFLLGRDERNTDKHFKYAVMMCAFVLKSRHKDEEIDGELRGEIMRILAGEQPKPQTSQTQNASPTSQQNVGATPGGLPGTSSFTVTS